MVVFWKEDSGRQLITPENEGGDGEIHCLGCSSRKPRSRSIGVRVCLVAQFNFFSTAFDPRAWTMVVFWKENVGRQPQLITPENEGRDETSSPSPPKFFDDPDVPFGPCGPPAPLGPRGPPGSTWPTIRMASSSITC